MPTYKMFGSGDKKVLTLHGWFSDSACYEPLLPYLNPAEFSFLFLDLRGYGVAKEFKGEYSLDEAVKDALSLVQSRGWDKFSMVAQSMGSLVAQKIALEYTARVKKIVAVSPVPASGSPRTPEMLSFLERAAIEDDDGALECIHILTNRRYSDYVAGTLATRWKSISSSEARLSYLHMLCETDFSQKVRGLKTPLLTVFGEHSPEHEESVLRDTFLKWYPNIQVETCKHAGHFLLQEAPVHLASLITRFLS